MPGREPVQVTVADIETIPGEDLEMRILVKLRVQNLNDAAIEYDGIYVKQEVLDKTFTTGASSEHGTIPHFGESIVSVPVEVSCCAWPLMRGACSTACRSTSSTTRAAHVNTKRNILEPGDVEEGLRAAAVGDDRIQMASRGYVSPELFAHGSSEQRMRWFRRGLEAGDVKACDAFAIAQR